jgi:hypothetical protein
MDSMRQEARMPAWVAIEVATLLIVTAAIEN